ncbi:DUF4350 domain-containing protein [Mycetocola saprophilus]|uniref:DUF4350 domain-containing protein n=1 Tax=Mycetocola saprophilus TaxID=76636 RepID=UPI0006924C19|nr:DUF4350 domain-containing protein [Mycetocola saprophilus]
MSVRESEIAPEVASAALTPTVRGFLRQRRFWIITAAVIILIALVLMVLGNAGNARGRELSAEDPSPVGARAVANVLRDHGVRITIANSYEQATSALESEPGTLLFADLGGYLDAERVRALSDAATSTVLVDPGFSILSELDLGAMPAGVATEDVSDEVACRVPAALRAGSITTGRVFQSESATGCFGTDTDGYSLVVSADRRVTLLGSRSVLQNDSVLREGNAALAVGLLGEKTHLVWYLPTAADLEDTGITSLEDATPTWLTPVLLLVFVTALAAFVWRGRRFGKLVAEDLPVVVPASETRRGRARLYQRVGARTRALDALRIGVVDRSSALLGLPRQTPADQVAITVADRLGRSRAEVFDLLIARPATNEAELVRLARALHDLEDALAAALDPTRPTPPGQAPHPTDPSSLDRK